ncbi:hypothetical protein BU17DRAFT_64913 [Hysterangium stoloniferum]|nr:hypothetical protein BU17DRAFT_64913 [Hysterangium stoloniferum]
MFQGSGGAAVLLWFGDNAYIVYCHNPFLLMNALECVSDLNLLNPEITPSGNSESSGWLECRAREIRVTNDDGEPGISQHGNRRALKYSGLIGEDIYLKQCRTSIAAWYSRHNNFLSVASSPTFPARDKVPFNGRIQDHQPEKLQLGIEMQDYGPESPSGARANELMDKV